jgi:hypothetical protein
MNRSAQCNLFSAAVAAVLGAAFTCIGCDSQQTTAARANATEPLPVGTTHTAQEDDVIAPLYSHDDVQPSAGSNARTSLAAVGTSKPSPAPKTEDAAKPAAAADRAEQSPDAEETTEKAATAVPERRTSMPQRRGSNATVVKGGVRKALPVSQAAAPLFGKWTIDPERSSKGFVNADALLFLADGRMRIWRGGAPEDGRWTWDSSEGIKTGGFDGVPFVLGDFDQAAGEIIITRRSDGESQTLILQPDRLFVAPPPVTTGAQAPTRGAAGR